MSSSPLAYRWSSSEFVRAWEAGAFDHRVELVEGEVWPVVIGSWHGETQARVISLLPRERAVVTSATLPSGDSLPDPDAWVRRSDAEPVRTVGTKVNVWDPADVLLVVEVSDDSIVADLNIKAALYGQAGYQAYWVVTPDAIFEHTSPSPQGYRTRREYRSGERIPVAYAGTDLAVDAIFSLEPE